MNSPFVDLTDERSSKNTFESTLETKSLLGKAQDKEKVLKFGASRSSK
jgi:hypothetical protein